MNEKAIELLEANLENSSSCCVIGIPEEFKIQYLALQLTIAQALALLGEPECKTKLYSVNQCDSKECPFRISGIHEDHCRLTKKDLTSTIYPLPDHCPLLEYEIKVKRRNNYENN